MKLKVNELDSSSKGFNIKVKILKKEKDTVVKIKKTQMNNRVANFVVGDETGTTMLTVWGADIDRIPIEGTISIKKSYVREFKNKLYLNIGIYSDWKVCSENINVKKTLQISKHQKTPIKICNILSKKKGIHLDKVKVLEIKNIRQVTVKKDGSKHEVADTLLGDETGVVKCSLWDDDIQQIEEGMILRINNAYVSTFRGVPQLNLSRYSKYEILAPEDLDINIENNLSIREQAEI